MTLTVTIDRTALTLPDLVIAGSRAAATAGFWIPADGFQLPGFAPRYSYAPDSAYVAGRQLLAAVLEQATLPLAIRASAASAAALATKRAELEAALSQFSFPITIALDGVSQTWSADYSWPQWATPDAVMRLEHTARAAVVVPVNPT